MNVSFVVPQFFMGGRIFAEHDPVANRDDCLRPFIELRSKLKSQGICLATQDEIPIEISDAILCLNMPKAGNPLWRYARKKGVPVHVLALESEFIHTDNANSRLIDQCATVFTYRDDVIDGGKFFPIRFAQQIRPPLRHTWEGRRFACMICGNKASSHSEELYSHRLEAIRWYGAHHPDLFDLYGSGWDGPTPSNVAMRVARRLPLLRTLLAPRLPVYRGTVEEKFETLANYRYCFCYENFSAPPGWITEKIFDAMFAGCVPVYWGPANIGEHIPIECFVDASDLREPKAIHERLMSLSDEECDAILRSIEDYLASSRASDFSIKTFVTTVERRLRAMR